VKDALAGLVDNWPGREKRLGKCGTILFSLSCYYADAGKKSAQNTDLKEVDFGKPQFSSLVTLT